MTKEIITAQNESDVINIIRNSAAEKSSIEIRGGGTHLSVGHDVGARKQLCLKAVSGVELYEPGALTIVAKSGTTLDEINTILKSEKQRLAFEPVHHNKLLGSTGATTIGGIVACNISGPRRVSSGACRDSLLGIKFVDGHGELIKNGGRVMKNVTGYDLSKLICGAYGTLGVITEVSLKVLPIKEAEVTLAFYGLDTQTAVTTLNKALCSPYEITGAAYIPDDKSNSSQTLIRIEGFEKQVEYRVTRLKEMLDQKAECEVIRGQLHTDLWTSIRDISFFSNLDNLIWRLSIRPTKAPEIIDEIKQKLDCDYALDWAGGLIWLSVPPSQAAHEQIIRSSLIETGGHASLIRAPHNMKKNVKVFHPLPSNITKLMQSIKEKIDPMNIINPGRLGFEA